MAGYGESTQLRGRNFETVADDIEDLANALGVDKFYIAAVSGGGPFALATAALLPLRLKGLLLLSAAGSPGMPSQSTEAKINQLSSNASLHSS